MALGRTTHVRQVLTLTQSGIARLRRCTTPKLEVRMIVRRASRTTTVRDRRTLKLDAKRCPAPAPAPADPAPEPTAPAPVENKDQPKTDRSLFRVGTSVVDISPDKPMHVGGYGSGYQRDRRRP